MFQKERKDFNKYQEGSTKNELIRHRDSEGLITHTKPKTNIMSITEKLAMIGRKQDMLANALE